MAQTAKVIKLRSTDPFVVAVDCVNEASTEQMQSLANTGKISLSTLYRWRSNPPTRPHYNTVHTILRHFGYKLKATK